MESKSKIEVSKEMENHNVDPDSKGGEINDLSINSNDQMIESVTELCKIDGYELSMNDPPIKFNQFLENGPNCPQQLAQSHQTDDGVSITQEETVVAATDDKSSDFASVEPVKSPSNVDIIKVEGTKVAEDCKAVERAGASNEFEGPEGLDDDAVFLPDKDNNCGESTSAPINIDNPDAPCIDEDPRSFMNRLNSKLAIWKDCEGVRPPGIEQIVQESDADNATSKTPCHDLNSVKPVYISEWQNMNYSEKATFISFRRAGIPREEAIAKINEARLERGIPVLKGKTSHQEVMSQSCQSSKTYPSLGGSTQKVANTTQKLELDLNDEEMITFRELRRIGLPCEEARAKILESREKLGSCVIQANLAASKAKQINRVQKPLMMAKHLIKEKGKILNRFNKKQKILYSEFRKKNISHPEAVDKVMEMSEKLGIVNISLANFLSTRSSRVSTPSFINPALLGITTNVPTSGDSAVSNCQQPVDVTENIVAETDDMLECCKHYPKYSDLIMGLFRDPRCKYSLGEIIQMAELIPEVRGIFARKLFILRCFKFGVEPENWDWKQYSEIPSIPKILKVPPRHSQRQIKHQESSKLPLCAHSSCRYYYAAVGYALKHQSRQGCSSAKNVRVRYDLFRPHKNSPRNMSGIPTLKARDESDLPSSKKRKNSDQVSIEDKISKFVEDSSTDFSPLGTRSTPTQDIRLYIVSSYYPSELLDDEEIYKIENQILEVILDIHDERMRPVFKGSFHNNGRFEVICQDQFSKEWLYKYISCLSPSASLKIIPAELMETSYPQCSNYETRETQYFHEPGYAKPCSSHEQGFGECSVYVDPLLHIHSSSSKQTVQDRLGPKIMKLCGSESSKCDMHVSGEEGPGPSNRGYTPDYSDELPMYNEPSWDVYSSSASHENIIVEVTRSQSPVYNHSEYTEASMHDIRHRVDVSKSHYNKHVDYVEHSEYFKPPGQLSKPSTSYRDSHEEYHPNLVVTRSRSPKYDRCQSIEQPLELARSYSPISMDYEEHCGHNELSWHDETSNNHFSRQNTRRPYSGSPSLEYRGSRNYSGYKESSRDSYYHSQSPEELRSDARERLTQIRSKQTSVKFAVRGFSPPESSCSYSTRYKERLRSPPLCTQSASRTSSSKYKPSQQYRPLPPFSGHFSKHL